MDGDDFMLEHQMKFDNDEFEETIYDEDKYNALNDETFGNDMSDGDWEADHEKYAEFDENSKNRWPNENELVDNICDTYTPETNHVFSAPLKSLPDLENELRQLHTYSNHYEIPTVQPSPVHYQNNMNFINQNMIINLPSDPMMRIPLQAPNMNTIPQNNFNIPHEYEFRETNGCMPDNTFCKPQKKVVSSPISVADLERQLIDAVKVNPSYNNQFIPEVNQGFIQNISPFFQSNAPQYSNLPNIHPASIPRNFPKNNHDPRNQINNYKRFNNTNAGYQNFPKTKNYMSDEHLLDQADNNGAGFMTLREKHWLAGIQTIQFNNSNPLEDDFYFTMYQKRHYGSSGPRPNNLFYQSDQSKANNSYTQLHFENSLGKVQIGNVITPRRTIDIETNDFAPSNTNTTNTTPANRGVIAQKNSKQILLEIEHMYIPLLKIEQTYYAMRHKSRAAPTVQLHIDELTNILTTHLHNLVAFVSIRKGKQLVHRILPHLKNPAFLWNMFFGPSICSVIAKDSDDQLLLLFLPYIRQWIFCLCLAELNQIAEYFMKNLPLVLISVFGISVIANMIERAEEIRSTDPKAMKQWSVFISNIISISSESLIQRPVIGLDKRIIEKHLQHLPFDQSITHEKKRKFVHQLSFLGDTTKK